MSSLRVVRAGRGALLLPGALLPVCAALALLACDDSQAWHEPDFSLARMQSQPRVDPFDREMTSPPPFTVARGAGSGRVPPVVTRALVERGRDHFDTICATCHGVRGDGESVVATKMLLRAPPSLLEPRIRALSDEQLGEIIGRGYGLMPPFANALPDDERLATVAYVRALEVAQGIDVALLPAAMADDLPREVP
jgi:mono/diheme cytochrome c family protein